jgi:restriction system protein
LSRFIEYAEYITPNKSKGNGNAVPATDETTTLTPQERIEKAHRELNQILKTDLMERILSCSPEFFEKLIIDLMIGMGYGGSLKEAAEHVGKANDGGVDGVINEDQLGLDRIYLQAKRYAEGNTVGRQALQGFAGSLLGRGANKGVFVTTSSFTKGAIEYVENLPQRIVLIDGDELTSLMIKHSVGVRMEQRFELMKADEDYYIED